MEEAQFIQGMLDFIQRATTPFHAVQAMAEMLDMSAFKRLHEGDAWNLRSDAGYYVIRNDSALIAFRKGVSRGIRMAGAHTDSPCLKIKPNPVIIKKSYFQLGLEVYGSAILDAWFDRDLSIAGRVTYVTRDKIIRSALIDFKKPLAVIPRLAVHLNRDNKNSAVNPQNELPSIIFQISAYGVPDFKHILVKQLRQQHPDCDAVSILQSDLLLYDTQPPALVGYKDNFIAGARLDNLISCYTGIQSLLSSESQQSCLLVCNNHEEVGSISSVGAGGPFLKTVLERLSETGEVFHRMIAHSMMISADNAHGVHPNYTHKYDENHGPVLNGGPVIKINANQRYATDSKTAACFRYLCQKADLPVQTFAVRSDMACGSTIGPLTAAAIGVKTLDVGVPTLAMHSIRELAGRRDAYYLFKILLDYFDLPKDFLCDSTI